MVDNPQKLLSANVATIWFLEREKLTQVTVKGTYLIEVSFSSEVEADVCISVVVVVVSCLYIRLGR